MKHPASRIFMIKPVKFGYNEQTAGSNSFQNKTEEQSELIQTEALKEFNALTAKLITAGIDVQIFEDTIDPHTPDSIFPNNWISFHGKMIVLYPMLAENRRHERRTDIVNHFSDATTSVFDISDEEHKNTFLEGTGSLVFDYENKIAYANLSPRSDRQLITDLCNWLNYHPVTFKAVDKTGLDIYHTNVLMSVGVGFAVICTDCIPDQKDLKKVIGSFEKTGHKIIPISVEQMNSFAGNMYQLFNTNGKSYIVMSEQAFLSLDKNQITELEHFGEILHSPLYTIEKYGGGSARCMIADVRR
ncbi:MAG: amidinotransferase [Bacteroidota bacterium]|jgi:hypothetical protein|nr:amidinotransferase [Bacteroidota bacterium]